MWRYSVGTWKYEFESYVRETSDILGSVGKDNSS